VTTVNAVTLGSSTGDLTTGFVKLDHPATAHIYKTSGTQDGPNVFNLGQGGEATRTLIDVVNGQLRTTDMFTAGATANPIAQNVVLIKAQFGVDCGVAPFPPAFPFIASGVVVWTPAIAAGPCGRGYRPDDLTNTVNFNAASLATIRAVRIAIVVRSDEPDLKDATLVGQKAVLFDCASGPCLNKISLDNQILTDFYRFRIYETVVPMRNAIFNDGT